MKDRKNVALAVAFGATLALSVLVLYGMYRWGWLSHYPKNYYLEQLRYFVYVSLLFVLPAAPVFCLQLLACRAAKHLWVKLLPLLIPLGFAAPGAYYYFFGKGWDTLGGAVLLLFSLPPALGCLSGWLAYRLKGAVRRLALGTVLALVLYALLRFDGSGRIFQLRLCDVIPAVCAAAWIMYGARKRTKPEI